MEEKKHTEEEVIDALNRFAYPKIGAFHYDGNIYEDALRIIHRLQAANDPFWFCAMGGCEGVCKQCKDTCPDSILVRKIKEGARGLAKTIKSVIWEETENETIRIKDLHKVVDDIVSCHYSPEVMLMKEKKND